MNFMSASEPIRDVTPPMRGTPERTPHRRKLTAILCADIAGYSRLMGDDEAATYEALTRLLAETFGLRNDQVSLSGGASSRLKRFQLAGVDLDDFRRLLERSLEPGGAGAGPQARLSPH